MPRKHLIAAGINKKQQSQAKIWNKLAKEIKAATKVGGANPDTNPRLKTAIDKALQNNLSRESIERNINGASIDKSQQNEYLFEIYGPNSIAIMVMALTDNQNRVISSLNGYLSKLKGEIASTNSVKILFQYCGEILIATNNYSSEEIENIQLKILDISGEKKIEIIDIIINEDCIQILVDSEYFYKLRDEINKLGFKIFASEIKYIPYEYVNLKKDSYEKLERFLNSCEEDDDIQWVITNFGEVE